MSTTHRIRRSPVLLLLSLAASLACSTTRAHDVHDEEHHGVATTDEVRSLIRAFRETGDDRHLDAAWHQVQPLIQDGTADASTLVDAATIAQARHDFDSALAMIDRALVVQPGFDQAWLLRASVQLVRGKPDEAAAACAQLRNTSLLIAATCRARVAIGRGEPAQARQTLSAMLAVIDTQSLAPETLAWTLSVAGDAAADPEEAIDLYQRSLDLVESTQVRAALVDVLLATDQTDDARFVLNQGHDALPLAVRRLIVAVRSGERDHVATEIARMDHRFRHWIQDEDWAHAREMARFYIDVIGDRTLARRLARINLDLQREPEDLLLAHRTGA